MESEDRAMRYLVRMIPMRSTTGKESNWSGETMGTQMLRLY